MTKHCVINYSIFFMLLSIIPGCTPQRPLVKRHLIAKKQENQINSDLAYKKSSGRRAHTISKKTLRPRTYSPESSAITKNQEKLGHKPIITIWIHGTRIAPRYILKNLLYSRPGIHPIKDFNKKYRLRSIADALSTADPELYPLEHIYQFGWSGNLCFLKREQEAELLYKDLLDLINQYKATYDTTPYIRIIGHSHGGNIALNLVPLIIKNNNILTIDELILLATPVQEKTAAYITDPSIKKAYSLYSKADLIQVIDPQKLYMKFSKHRHTYNFPKTASVFSHQEFSPHKNLDQIQIKLNGRAILHNEFISSYFVKLLPQIIHEINLWHTEDDLEDAYNPNSIRILKIRT